MQTKSIPPEALTRCNELTCRKGDMQRAKNNGDNTLTGTPLSELLHHGNMRTSSLGRLKVHQRLHTEVSGLEPVFRQCRLRVRVTATAGSDVVQSGRKIFDDFFQHLWPYIGNNTANVVFQMIKRLWLIRIDQ
ncbi:hypothetical protein TNCV_1070741 [Trichonephila clavipes]|nr:hypothetical protein TNCV_1070741 [Trichonephila clavipes]